MRIQTIAGHIKWPAKNVLSLTFLLGWLFLAATVQAQSKHIEGTITDPKGAPLAGVNVQIKGAGFGTISNKDGKYALVADPGATLVFSYTSFQNIEEKVGDRTVINVSMQETNAMLDNVVVVGYGTQKKVNLSGSVAQVTGKDLANRPVANVTGALQGIMPGVAVVRGSGKPGSEGYGIRVRGFTSANDANALVLVDGIEQDLNLIDPSDVESISVLKDASASAIYGARAAAGVILVTTKQAKSGKTSVTFSSNYGVNITARQPQRLNSWDEQTLIEESRINNTGSGEYTPENFEWLMNPNMNVRPNPNADRWEYFDNNNWIKEGMDKYNHQQNHSLSVGGGESKLNYLFTGAYYKRDGVLRFGPDDNTRINLKLNVNAELSKYISLKLTTGYINTRIRENAFGTEQIINRLYRSRTRQSLYTPAEDTTGQPYNGDLQINPVDIEKNGGLDNRKYGTFTSRLGFQVKNVVPGLTLDVIGWRNQGDYNAQKDSRSITWYGRSFATTRAQVNVPNAISVTKNKSYQNNLQSFLTYKLKLNKHEFTILQGGSYEEFRKDEMNSIGQNISNNDFFSLNYADPLTVRSSQKIETWALASLFGRLNYSFAGKYLLEASYRYDGSSRLAPKHRWDLFPSFSAAWRVSEEDFFKDNVPFVQNFKIRGSWGQLGNGSPLGLYPYMPLLVSGLSNPNNATTPALVLNDVRSQYIYQDTLESPDVTWETVQQSNIGIDLGLLDNRLTITADYYVKKNKDMLAYLNLPNIIGIGTPAYNVGEMKSWGTELEVKWKDHIGDIEYRLGFNISDNQNKLLKYEGKNSIGTGGVVKYMQGYALNTVWGYQTAGLIQSKEDLDTYKSGFNTQYFTNLGPGDMKYVDKDGNRILGIGDGTPQNPGDLVYLGTTNARYNYGFDVGFSWKGFDFSAFFQGAAKRKFLIREETLSPMLGTADMPWTIHWDRWTPDNPNAFFPRMYQTDAHNFKPSDRWVQDGSYLRLKNIQLGYTVPVNKKFIRNLQVYISGQDLWEKTKVLSVFDPEVGNNVDATSYPFYRTVSFGVNAGF